MSDDATPAKVRLTDGLGASRHARALRILARAPGHANERLALLAAADALDDALRHVVCALTTHNSMTRSCLFSAVDSLGAPEGVDDLVDMDDGGKSARSAVGA